ncbi:IS1182 family transposase [Caloramator sp. E03]|uniref:IS1182 family transposase n=1 Tax=Caloramator sp. E03 TaxID=2576307 RepID=UPI001FAA527B|nr:IS1182 family transposase [Caloramator sp. E03]
MLTKEKNEKRTQIEICSIDQLVPENHLVRKLEAAINFDFIYDLVSDKYSKDIGRPSIDPVVLFKIVFIQYVFGIKSMRQTISEIQTNIAYRWFIGYGLYDPIPHFTTFGKNYVRRFKNTDIFEKIFVRILEEAVNAGLIKSDAVFIDATHVKANANKKKYDKVKLEKEARVYQELLDKEINEDRELHGKKPLDMSKKKLEVKETKISKTDPDSGVLRKNEKEKCFAYSFHAACDRNGFILGITATAANVHDNTMFDTILEQVKKNVGKPEYIVVDAGYKTPYICKTIIDQGIRPVMPYTRPMTKEGFFKKYEYVYDEYYDCYICPNNQILNYRTTNREGYREYASDSKTCKDCPYRNKCTNSKDYTKVINRHIWADYVEEAEHLRYTTLNKEIYEKRKETIERVFADMKEKHGMRFTTLRGLKKVTAQAMLVAACMNLKKMANWLWRSGKTGPNKAFLLRKLYILHLKTALPLWRAVFVYNLKCPQKRAFLFII